MSSYVHINNNKKDILTTGKSLTQGLDDTQLIADAKCYSAIFWLNITAQVQKAEIENFTLVCIIMGATAYSLSMLKYYINSKQKILKLKNIPCAQEIVQKKFYQLT